MSAKSTQAHFVPRTSQVETPWRFGAIRGGCGEIGCGAATWFRHGSASNGRATVWPFALRLAPSGRTQPPLAPSAWPSGAPLDVALLVVVLRTTSFVRARPSAWARARARASPVACPSACPPPALRRARATPARGVHVCCSTSCCPRPRAPPPPPPRPPALAPPPVSSARPLGVRGTVAHAGRRAHRQRAAGASSTSPRVVGACGRARVAPRLSRRAPPLPSPSPPPPVSARPARDRPQRTGWCARRERAAAGVFPTPGRPVRVRGAALPSPAWPGLPADPARLPCACPRDRPTSTACRLVCAPRERCCVRVTLGRLVRARGAAWPSRRAARLACLPADPARLPCARPATDRPARCTGWCARRERAAACV